MVQYRIAQHVDAMQCAINLIDIVRQYGMQ